MYSFDDKGLYKGENLLLNWADVRRVETVYYNHSFSHTFWISGIPRGRMALPILLGTPTDQLEAFDQLVLAEPFQLTVAAQAVAQVRFKIANATATLYLKYLVLLIRPPVCPSAPATRLARPRRTSGGRPPARPLRANGSTDRRAERSSEF